MGESDRKTVLVVDSNPVALALVAGTLEDAGFAVICRTDGESAREAAIQVGPDLTVVDMGTALDHLKRPLMSLELESRLKNIPVVLTATDPAQLQENPLLALSMSDYLIHPFNPAELVHRAHVAILRSEYRAGQRAASQALRGTVREISASIKGTHEPWTIAGLTADGLGKAFEPDHVQLLFFEDERISCEPAQWSRSANMPAVSFEGIEEETRLLALTLWRTAEIVAVTDGIAHNLPPNLPNLGERIRLAGLTGLALPIGEGESAFGLLWLSTGRRRRPWTATELSLLQHLLGNLAHGLIQGQLIISQQQVMERLRELDVAKSRFVATVHHELRTPLASMLGYLELVQDGSGGDIPDDARKMLDVIKRNTERLSSMTENILALSRLDSGVSHPTAPVDIGDVLRSVASVIAPIAMARNVSLEQILPESKLFVDGVEELLERAFINIVSNAVKFTPPGGAVEIFAHANADDGGAVTVEVKDTGIGIPADELNQLFTRFYRASNSVAEAVPGTGLGLTIAKAAVEKHRGSLGVSSVLGVGTTVTIDLPGQK
ncbi:ATP-binding protein [Arthrobacter sp. H5]|uniref:ATP-binding response regulator n=1 Tax=Arthrobacter sp. H5 TaxID=1267973 RepID=UPI0004BAB6E3|nr:ATP-binding protein [Arthrobacter sp. H5]